VASAGSHLTSEDPFSENCQFSPILSAITNLGSWFAVPGSFHSTLVTMLQAPCVKGQK